MTDDPLDRDLDQAAENPKLAKAVRASLERLRAGAAGPAMAEMATELLEGRTTLREVGRSGAYADHLRDAVAKYDEWQSHLTPEQRAELRRKVREDFGTQEQQG